jgi:nitric oxide reductase NorD protein
MAEAEDILLHATERATAAVRALWQRHSPPQEPPGAVFGECSRRLSMMIQACVGRSWPLFPVEPDAAPNWLAARLKRLPPWVHTPHAHAFTDGEHLFLPRRLQVWGDKAKDGECMRCMALVLALRLDRGAVALCPFHPVARDLFWAVDGAMVEGLLATAWPGLRASMTAVRHYILATRPSLARLTPRERAVEQVVRGLLEVPPGEVARVFPDAPSSPAPPEDVVHWARRRAQEPPFYGMGPYRGMAPVLHWGRPRPELLAPPVARRPPPQGTTESRPMARWQRVSQRIEARDVAEEEHDARQGPFLLPPGDPQQTVADPAGLRRPLDQGEEPDLEALAEELARLGHLPRVESDTPVREILEVEGVRPRQTVSHRSHVPEAVGFAYPEWDYRVGRYRPDYCVLRETVAPPGDAQWPARMLRTHGALIHTIRRRFKALHPKRQRSRRQLDGHDIDLDAYVEDFATRCAGRTPSARLYLTDRPRQRDVSVAFLIDASGSTDAWVSRERRVLDIEKEATLVFCEALEALGDPYAIYAFAGRGARNVRVLRVKGFADSYGESVRVRIAGLSGEAFTRLGVPIRHLTALLSRQRTRLRLLLLLSDGKPNDEDAYEGAYGIEDTRQAVAEARVQGVNLFSLTIDRQHAISLPHIFGAHGYTTLWDITQLPQRLPEIYRRLTTVSPRC